MKRNIIPAHLRFNKAHSETIERAKTLVIQNIIPSVQALDELICEAERKTETYRHYNIGKDPLADARLLHGHLVSLIFGFWSARTEELRYPIEINLLLPSQTVVKDNMIALDFFYADLAYYLDQQTAFKLISEMMDDLKAVIFVTTEITVWQSTARDGSEFILKITDIDDKLFLTKEVLVGA